MPGLGLGRKHASTYALPSTVQLPPFYLLPSTSYPLPSTVQLPPSYLLPSTFNMPGLGLGRKHASTYFLPSTVQLPPFYLLRLPSTLYPRPPSTFYPLPSTCLGLVWDASTPTISVNAAHGSQPELVALPLKRFGSKGGARGCTTCVGMHHLCRGCTTCVGMHHLCRGCTTCVA